MSYSVRSTGKRSTSPMNRRSPANRSTSPLSCTNTRRFDELAYEEEFDKLCDDTASKSSLSVRDLYKGAAGPAVVDTEVNYQKGLSNYSHIELGDPRVSYNRSVAALLHCTDGQLHGANQKNQYMSESARHRLYEESKAHCGGEAAIDNIEKMIKLKLEQRLKFGVFQLHKNFKYHDRANTGYIGLYEFTKALEFLGFQFTTQQNTALFARFDTECSGLIYYLDVEKFFRAVDFKTHGKTTIRNVPMKNVSDNEIINFQRAELKSLFDSVDRDGRGCLSPHQLLTVLSALGADVGESEIPDLLGDMQLTEDDDIDFNKFYSWWTQSPQFLL